MTFPSLQIAQLQNPEILQDVRRALQAAAAHLFSGEQRLLCDYPLSLFCEPSRFLAAWIFFSCFCEVQSLLFARCSSLFGGS